jgi:hypothetical protein
MTNSVIKAVYLLGLEEAVFPYTYYLSGVRGNKRGHGTGEGSCIAHARYRLDCLAASIGEQKLRPGAGGLCLQTSLDDVKGSH